MNKISTQNDVLGSMLARFRLQRGLAFGVIIIAALLAFEIFNYSTTDFALHDLLGDLSFLAVPWSTILAMAFCGIDFAGIARLFTPEDGNHEPNEIWYLFGAWLLAATMNAMLTWWGVSIAILNHQSLGSNVIERQTLLKVVPIFVAVLVWLIRVLIIGTFSVAGDRLFSQSDHPNRSSSRRTLPVRPTATNNPVVTPRQASSGASFRSASKTGTGTERGYSRPEPTYHPATMSSRPSSNGGKTTLRS